MSATPCMRCEHTHTTPRECPACACENGPILYDSPEMDAIEAEVRKKISEHLAALPPDQIVELYGKLYRRVDVRGTITTDDDDDED